MIKVSARERQFLLVQNAWALAMSGRYRGWPEAAPLLLDADEAPARIVDPLLARRLDAVCAQAHAARSRPPPGTPGDAGPEAAIRQVLTRQHVAYWMRDEAEFAAVHCDGPELRMLAWVNSGGMTDRRGWEALRAGFRHDVERFPLPNAYLAYLTDREHEVVRVSGDMAWASYDLVYPTANLPRFNGFGRSRELRALERTAEGWKIAAMTTLDDQFGQTEAPVWEVDGEARVLAFNALAETGAARNPDISVRGGRLRLRGDANDARLRDTVRSAAEVPHGLFSRYRARSMVFQPGDGSTFRVLWVINQGSRMLVTLVDPPVFAERLETATSAYGLSPTQCRLVGEIMNGTSLAGAARLEGIGVTTARTQLQRVFEKIGVRSQSGLIAALVAAMEHAPMD